MMAFAYYLLKVVICSGILFLYYHAFLRNRVFHRWNRFYLLSAVVLSLCLPLIKLDVLTGETSTPDLLNYLLLAQSADTYLEEFTVYYRPGFQTSDWLLLGYALVSAAVLIALLISISKIINIIRRHTATRFHNIRLFETREPGTPFSFLHFIFWNEEIPLHTTAGQQIFQHELVHVKDKHTWDKLFMQVVLVFFWCNPIFWLIRRELRLVHEFIADQKAVGNDTEAFAAMILQAVYPAHADAIRNPFFHSSIKRRLHMLTQLQNPKVAYFSRLAVLPLTALVFLAFTVRTNESGQTAAQEWFGLTNADTLPKKSGIVSVDVRKNKEKNQNEIEIHYNDGRKEVLSEKEAVAKGLINLDYSNNKPVTVNGTYLSSTIRLRDSTKKPLLLLDGREITQAEMHQLDPKDIESINVLKDNSAEAKYGKKGKNGVIEITLKKQSTDTPTSFQKEGEQVQAGTITRADHLSANSVNLEAEEIVVSGRKINRPDTTPGLKEVVVTGYPRPSGKTEITVVGKRLSPEPVFEKPEFDPSIDPTAWRQFLEKYTMSFIEEIGKKAPTGNYTVNVRFIVERDGTISNVSVLNDPGYGIGSKVLEMMKHAPKWKPAIQNQRVVRSYHTQPITFVIADT
jgi:TonB-dependent SusC/RagA subfamily outer membrane receptor